MIRVVSLRKAALAGAAGALAWEATLRGLILAGLPLYDMVRQLGTLPFPNGGPELWWPAGMVFHSAVGVLWALFYAYFFWARLKLPPALQGLLFAIAPAVAAIVLVAPQLRLMHLDADVVRLDWPMLLEGFTLPIIAGLLSGHAAFGLTAGAFYTRPVGYRTGNGSRPSIAKRRERTESATRGHSPSAFIFATGIECSYPTIEEGLWRRDEMAGTGHYSNWQEDFELAREIGATHIRYGPPLHLVFTGPGQWDWELIDGPMEELRTNGPEPIVDLCHFGLPDWLGNFQNPGIAPALGEYAGAFAQRYPWVRFFTPVNEMYVCARMSALEGLWNEQLRDERAFLAAAVNLARSNIAMTDAILETRPEAILVNSESSEFRQPCCPDEEIERIARFENERRFLPLDLIYAHEVGEEMRSYLRDNGLADEQYRTFMEREVPRRSVLGVDYYEWNERLIDRGGEDRALGELFGWYVIASQYWERYQRTMMHTETNRNDAADAPRWLWRQWHNVQLLRQAGVPLVGFTWYSLTDQVDWHIGMTKPLGLVNAVGLLDLNRDPRVVGLAYKHLIGMYRDEPEYRDCPALRELIG